MAGYLLFLESLGSQAGTEKFILSASMPELAPEVSVSCNVLEGLRGVSVLLEILQENDLLELLPSLYGTTELEVLAKELKMFTVVLARSSSGISRVTELQLVRSLVVFLPLCCCILCPCAHPLLRRASRRKQCFLISWLECSNPDVISGIFLYFFYLNRRQITLCLFGLQILIWTLLLF